MMKSYMGGYSLVFCDIGDTRYAACTDSPITRRVTVNRTRQVIIGLALGASVAFPFPEHEMNAGRVLASADEPIIVTGLLTDEGVECPALRAEDGVLYTLVGKSDPFKPGDRVTVTGVPVEISTCMQGTTLQVKAIRIAEPHP
jgi:hypothetical protein